MVLYFNFVKLNYELFLDSTSIESLSSSESENETVTNSSTNIEKDHTFFQKIVVIPEDCGQCQKKFVIKCLIGYN